MFKMTAEMEYGFLALLALSRRQHSAQATKAYEIAGENNLSEPFLLQVLMELKRAGLVESRRGKNGGFLLSRSPDQITVRDLLDATAGKNARQPGQFKVVSQNGFLPRWWNSVLEEVERLSSSVSIADALAEEQANQEPMYYI